MKLEVGSAELQRTAGASAEALTRRRKAGVPAIVAAPAAQVWHPSAYVTPFGGTMPTPLHELEAQVLSLAAEDRARLLERLIESFEPDTNVEKAWIAEALRREADVKAGKSTLIPGPEAVQRIRARLA